MLAGRPGCFFPVTRLWHIESAGPGWLQAHGKRTRSAQAVVAPHLPVADAGVRRARRPGHLPAAQADRGGVHGQSGPQLGDHFRPAHRHRALPAPGDPTLSRDRLGQQFPPGRSRPRGRAAAGAAGADGGDPRQPHRPHGDVGAIDARHSQFDRHPARRGARHLALHDRPVWCSSACSAPSGA